MEQKINNKLAFVKDWEIGLIDFHESAVAARGVFLRLQFECPLNGPTYGTPALVLGGEQIERLLSDLQSAIQKAPQVPFAPGSQEH